MKNGVIEDLEKLTSPINGIEGLKTLIAKVEGFEIPSEIQKKLGDARDELQELAEIFEEVRKHFYGKLFLFLKHSSSFFKKELASLTAAHKLDSAIQLEVLEKINVLMNVFLQDGGVNIVDAAGAYADVRQALTGAAAKQEALDKERRGPENSTMATKLQAALAPFKKGDEIPALTPEEIALAGSK